jgi:hypothetical protein
VRLSSQIEVTTETTKTKNQIKKMKLTKSKLKQIIRLAENGNSVTLLVCKALPQASESEIDNAIESVYDSMEFPHE